MIVPLIDLKQQQSSIQEEISSTIRAVLDEAHYIGGSRVSGFEEAFAAAHRSQKCVGVGNGTDAIFLTLKALGVGVGDRVIVPAFSFIASSEAISATGATPVFVDVSLDDYNLNVNQVLQLLEHERVAGRPIKAILVVHLYGHLCRDLAELVAGAKEQGVFVIEDSAQAHLARRDGQFVGNFGLAATFSFYPGKNLGAMGDGGAVITNDIELATKIRMLANHGRINKYEHEYEGYNSRLDTLQAAILNLKLRHLENWTRAREAHAVRYNELLRPFTDKIVLPVIPTSGEHSFHLYVIRVLEGRDRVLKLLHDAGIMAGVHYPVALHNLKAYSNFNHSQNDFPVASQLQDQVLSLPLFPELTREQQDYVVAKLEAALMTN